MRSARPLAGFTIIELLVVLTVMAILLGIATPRYIAHVDHARETALRHNLKALREAMEQFQADRGAPPQSLAELVQARYLREMPEDPMTERRDTWRFVPAQATAGAIGPAGRPAVFSGAPGVSREGTAYATW